MFWILWKSTEISSTVQCFWSTDLLKRGHEIICHTVLYNVHIGRNFCSKHSGLWESKDTEFNIDLKMYAYLNRKMHIQNYFKKNIWEVLRFFIKTAFCKVNRFEKSTLDSVLSMVQCYQLHQWHLVQRYHGHRCPCYNGILTPLSIIFFHSSRLQSHIRKALTVNQWPRGSGLMRKKPEVENLVSGSL
jgi:hypothetical protein